MKFTEEKIKTISRKRGIIPVKVTLLEKTGNCPHEVGESFEYHHPLFRPQGICGAAAYAMEIYIQRCLDGFPSWEKDNPDVYLIHCPSRKGTIWKIERVNDLTGRDSERE